MAKYWLINGVSISGVKRLAGSQVDDAAEPLAPYTAAGALLWPQGDATVDAAAARAQGAHLSRGASEEDMDAIMTAAVDTVQKANDSILVGISKFQVVTGTLVAGTATVTVGAGQAVTALTRAFPTPSAAITGTTNFGGLAHIFASNVVGGSGVGQVVINALGDDGAIDVDAAGTFAAILIN